MHCYYLYNIYCYVRDQEGTAVALSISQLINILCVVHLWLLSQYSSLLGCYTTPYTY